MVLIYCTYLHHGIHLCGWRDNRQEKADNPSHLGGQISACIILERTSELARVLVAKSQPMRLFLDSQNHSKSYFIQTPSL